MGLFEWLKKKEVPLVYLILVLSVSCKNEGKKKQFIPEIPAHVTLISDKKETVKLWKKAIDNGDFKAYNQVSNAYLLSDYPYELYYYSFIMANKFNCPEAYFHLYIIMSEKSSFDGLVLYSDDKRTKGMALYYLLKSWELGFVNAEYEIVEEFGKGKAVPRSSDYIKGVLE
jgi:hypothetical protein